MVVRWYQFASRENPQIVNKSRLNLLQLARLDIVNVPRDGHVEHKRALLQQLNVIDNTLLQVAKREEGNVVRILAQTIPNLGPDGAVGEGEHAAVGLFSRALARFSP